MAYSDFEALKAFFRALRESGSGKNRLPNNIKVPGGVIPTNYCFDVFRKFFPDFREKKNEEIIKYFAKDPRNAERLLATRFRPEERAELEKTLVEKPVVAEGVTVEQAPPAGAATGASAGGMPALPSAPSISSGPRISYNIPRALEQPKPEIHIANKSGYVTEAGDASKLVTTSGGVIKEAPPKQIFIANKSGVVTGVRNIKSPNWLKTFGSNAQIFTKRNLGKVFNGLKGIAGGVGRGITGPGLTGTANFLGRVGNGGLNMVERGLKSRGGGISRLSKSSNKLAWIAVGAFLFLGLVGGLLAGITGSTQTGEAAPVNSDFGLNYTLPLRDKTIVPQDVRSAITWPNAQIDNWQTIIDQAKAHGWNPALVLALWIEESGAQGITYDDPLGCDPTHPTSDINVSLTCFFNFGDKYNFTNDQFIDFMIRYGGGTPGQSLAGNANFPKFPNGVKDWYSKMVPTGPGAIQTVNLPTSASEPSGCPATGTIRTPYGFNIASYPDVSNEGCGALPKCHNGIDIAAPVGSTVRSTLSGVVSSAGSDPSLKGNFVEIYNQESGIIVTFEHLSSRLVDQNAVISKGDLLGQTGATGAVTGPTLHYKIRRGTALLNPFRFIKDSASISDKSKTQENSIAANNYAGVDNPSDIWGVCQ